MAREPIRAKKHLGQHFLRDEAIAVQIVEALAPTAKQVLEIGPGTGVLTRHLLQKPYLHFKVVEIDLESVAWLQKEYPQLGNDLVPGDFLRLDPSSWFEGPYSLIGNFPYNISSQIFFKVLENVHRIEEVVGMVQLEVAQRLAVGPGSKTYGILSVLLKAWYDVELLFKVPPEVFVPPPKVTSAVVRMRRNQTAQLACDAKLLHQVVKTAFNQRRKTLHNALKPMADYHGLFAGKRAEQLSLEQFVALTNEMETLRSGGPMPG